MVTFIAAHIVVTDDNDVFSSTADLTRLLQIETDFISDLHSLVDQLQSDVNTIKRFLSDHYEKREIINSWSYVSNPINALYLIKRLSVDYDRSNVSQVLSSNNTELLKSKMFGITNSSFPKHSDWIGAASGIYLLQEHYNLNISELSRGVIEYDNVKLNSDHDLGGEELYQIGVRAINEGHYDTGIVWLELAYDKLKNNPFDGMKTVDLEDLKKSIKTAKTIHDHYLEKAGVVGAKHRCNRVPFDEKLRKKKKYKAALKDKSTKRVERDRKIIPLFSEFRNDTLEKFKPIPELSFRDTFEDLCTGVEMRNASLDADQHCHHLHHADPFSRLGPFKLEILEDQPYTTLIHDLMTESEMEHFKNYASDKLERSGHGGSGKVSGITSFKRTSKQTWLEHRHFDLNITQEIIEKVGAADREEAEKILDEQGWTQLFMTKDRENNTDQIASKVSYRMER